MTRFVRLIIYSLCLMALPGYPSYDWRDALAKIVNASTSYTPQKTSIVAPTVYQSQGTPPPNAPAVGALGHYVNPDYGSLLQADPGFATANSSIGAAESTLGRTRADAVRRAIAQFGAAPSGWQSGYGDVDQASLQAAQQNPFSTMRQLTEARSRGSADLAAALGARGILSSGALTGGEQMLQRQFDQSSSDAGSKLMALLGGYEGDYASGYGSLENQRQQAYNDAAGRVAQLYPSQFVPEPVYEGPAGTPVQPVTYQGIGATPEPISSAPLQGPITSDMVAPPDPTYLNTVQPPTLPRRRAMGLYSYNLGG